MDSVSQKIVIGVFIALIVGIVGYTFASLEKMDGRISGIENREHKLMAALTVLETRAEERTARIEERIAALRREIMLRCDRIDKMLLDK